MLIYLSIKQNRRKKSYILNIELQSLVYERLILTFFVYLYMIFI